MMRTNEGTNRAPDAVVYHGMQQVAYTVLASGREVRVNISGWEVYARRDDKKRDTDIVPGVAVDLFFPEGALFPQYRGRADGGEQIQLEQVYDFLL